jgi:hypothetical protein
MLPFRDFLLMLVKANAWDLENAINLYLEGNYGNSGHVDVPAPPKAAGGAGGGTRVSPPLNHADFVNEQGGGGGGGEIDPRTLADEEMARYNLNLNSLNFAYLTLLIFIITSLIMSIPPATHGEPCTHL